MEQNNNLSEQNNSTNIKSEPNNDADGNNNLSDNKVTTEIEPKTEGNNVNLNLCSCVIQLTCCIN
jgi:hypothetical protein